MRFGVLGPLAVWSDDGADVPVPATKVRALLAALVLQAGRPVAASRLVDDLWGEALPGNPAGALQSKVSQLRRALDSAEPGGRDLVQHRAGGYVLDVEPAAVDRTEFGALVDRARDRSDADPETAVALLERALALWRGPALGDLAEHDFARPAAMELEEARLAALEDRIAAQLALGEHAAVVAELDRLVGEHPLRERLRALHMRALYRSGRQADALDSFRTLRKRLAEELGIDPGAEVADLFQTILQQRDDAPSARARRFGRPRTNLPAPRTSLVGRDAAVERVRRLLDDARLVTLTGAGGVGKTRLAMAVAAAVADELPDGAWLVELTGHDPHPAGASLDFIVERVAATLGIQDDCAEARGGTGGLLARVAAALQAQSLLLVLDNCERVVEPVAELVDRLLAGAPEVRVLVTSRRPLGLTGEQLWSVPPLQAPAADTTASPERLGRYPAVALFAERARAANADFAITEADARAVADLCRRLDGLPLALELAAARTRSLPVGELAVRLDDRFRLLAAGPADAPQRQRTLRAVVDWSWALLSGAERAVLGRLAVFTGGATLEAAEAVCAADDGGTDDVPAVLASLVDHSLVVVEERRGQARYRLLETIREYGLDRLREAGELDAVRRRHAAWHAQLAEAGDAALRGPEQQVWLERLDAAAADLRAAAEWAIAHEGALALRLAGAIAWHAYLRGRQGEANRLLRRTLAATDRDAAPAAHALALAWTGALAALERGDADPFAGGRAALERHRALGDPLALAHAQLLVGGLLRPWGEVPGGDRLVEEALAAFRRADDRWGLAAALGVRGWLALGRGDPAAAREDGVQARALFGDVGDRWGEVRTAELLGQIAEIHGDYARAAELHREALAAAEALGLWAAVAQERSRLGRLAALTGDHAEAAALHESALRLSRELSLDQGIVFAQVGLGLTRRRQGRLDDAEMHYRAVLDWHLERAFHSGTAFCLAELGFIAELRGDLDRARSLHLRGLAAAEEDGDPRALALALEGLAGPLAQDEPARAATLLGAAAAAREKLAAPLPPAERGDVERIAARAADALGADAFADAHAAGRALDLPAAVALSRG